MSPEINSAGLSPERKFRLNFSQTAKGVWVGEFTVRADTSAEASEAVVDARNIVEAELERLNKVPVQAPRGFEDIPPYVPK